MTEVLYNRSLCSIVLNKDARKINLEHMSYRKDKTIQIINALIQATFVSILCDAESERILPSKKYIVLAYLIVDYLFLLRLSL